MILTVLHVCERDSALASAALRASIKLAGRISAPLLISHPVEFDPSDICTLAARAFTDVLPPFAYTPLSGSPLWPRPQNNAWQSTARHLQVTTYPDTHGWFWWEADACPVRANWHTHLVSAFSARPRTLFAGHRCVALNGEAYMNGVGIWAMRPIDHLANCAALYAQQIPFDIAAGRCVMPFFKPLNDLLVHEVKLKGGGKGRTFTQGALDDLLATHPKAIFYHGCTDGSLHALVAGEPIPAPTTDPIPLASSIPASNRSTFYHSGDLGDVIYSLPTIRELGGGDLHLGPDNRTNMQTRAKMTLEHMRNIAPLLELQPYIATVSHSPTMPERVHYDLNQMRVHLRTSALDLKPGFNLARCYLHAFGIGLDNDGDPWLTVTDPRPVAPVVINRSPRYHNKTFRWDRVLAEYRGQLVFVGMKHEHEAFCDEWGRVPYEPTTNLLDLARVIAGSSLFIGNQSCAFSIAEGMKHPAVLELFPSGSNTIFPRRTVTHNISETTQFPFVPRLSRARRPEPGQPLVLRGPVDSFSGFSQLVRNLTLGLAARGHNVRLAPTHFERSSFQSDIPGIDPEYEALMVHPTTPGQVIISMHCGLPILIQGGEVVMTMWESSRIAHDTMRALNKTARVIVPSQWAATSFDACGVDTPISIVPLGIDTSIYAPRPYPKKGPFVFGTAGRTAHGGCRKGMDDVVRAFLAAFPTDPDVRLHVKCFEDCLVDAPADPRIVFERRFLPDLSDWYAGLNVFITASRGEGWGLHPHQALAVGRPVIAPRYGALTEFFDDSVGWPVPYKLVPAQGVYEGKGVWAETSHIDLARAMQHAYTHRPECASLARAASKRAHSFSIARMVDQFESVLKQEGLL